jgi:hypothetical protein
VDAVGVEPAEVFDDGELELGAGLPDAVGDEFGHEGVDEAFRQVVVVANRYDARSGNRLREELRYSVADFPAHGGRRGTHDHCRGPAGRSARTSSTPTLGERNELARMWLTPAPGALSDDLERFPGELADPFA